MISFCGYPGGAFFWDGGPYFLATFDAGTCRLTCPYDYQGACQVGEDCGAGLCAGDPEPIGPTGAFCNLQAPCDAGACIGPVTGGAPTCPTVCQALRPVHETIYGCICPGNSCVLPGLDGG